MSSKLVLLMLKAIGPTNAQGYFKSEKHKAEERAKRKNKGG